MTFHDSVHFDIFLDNCSDANDAFDDGLFELLELLNYFAWFITCFKMIHYRNYIFTSWIIAVNDLIVTPMNPTRVLGDI